MRTFASAIVALFLLTSAAIGSETPDNYRQSVRADPLIQSVIAALSAKHGCPWLHEPHGNGGMNVMKEVEPFFYSGPNDSYTPSAGLLEVRLACSHELSATVHTMFYEPEGHQPLVRFLDRIDFSYDNFLPRLGQPKPSGESLSKFILADPIVAGLYPVLTAQEENCDKIADGKIEIDPETKYRPALRGKNVVQLEYSEFELSFTCPRQSSGTTLQFNGGFYTESGLLTWKSIVVSGWVN